MYPSFNIDGIGSLNNSNHSEELQPKKEENPKDIDIFSNAKFTQVEDKNSITEFINTRKKAAEDASKKTLSHIDRVKQYIKQGYSYAKAIELAEKDEGGEVNRKNLVKRLEDQGYDKETAEKMIPKNIDERINHTRKLGKAQGEAKNKQLENSLNNMHKSKFPTYNKNYVNYEDVAE